ncbi:MAG: CoA activase [Deltaproteobacteria bacterium]|nr:CoA activase [Deltaproteobacteria bacterium]
MSEPASIIGIDIGSVTVSVVQMNLKGDLLNISYVFHRGQIENTLKQLLETLDVRGNCGIAVTSSTPPVVRTTAKYDTRVAVIEAARFFFSHIGSILLVGGEKFGLIRFDEDGNYLQFKANTSCAAGTGSFLDQQAARLNLAGIEQLAEMALKNRGAVPKIASRCAVFVKTDLIHAQQQGYTLAEICDGLCRGLAKNIYDTLFSGDPARGPIIFAGGVAKNPAVVKHIRSMLGQEVHVHTFSHLFGAVGAALSLMGEQRTPEFPTVTSAGDILVRGNSPKKYFHGPLKLSLSDYPDFKGIETYEFKPEEIKFSDRVEVDVYATLNSDKIYRVYLGIDVGSTSTKAVLLTRDKEVMAGFYTRTAGRPLVALQCILAALDDLQLRKQIDVQIIGAGTTGSGRKFIGNIIGADLVIDEITAHARAAHHINPKVDTIIEIGGQDSKFTTLQNGSVTFAAMNTVCAAGTGSFIEEQAQKLGCPLADYAKRAAYQKSPIASDRCTVFMERDINHYLNEGYSVDEMLATVVYAICENYLSKVAVEGSIGDTILFQGATAKNRALVAAFENRLKKPIHVSKYCHLTGALGVALSLADKRIAKSRFRGIHLYRKHIPFQFEICDICTNHCKITLAEIDGQKVAYGFLCERDYDTKRYVNKNRSGFDMIRERKRALAFKPAKDFREKCVIGIPAALHLYEDLEFWQYFFNTLGFKTVTSEGYGDGVSAGKHAAGAEFCAPVAALHGHVKYLMDKSDFIFLPFYLEKKSRKKDIRRQYCYYTQFAASLASAAFGEENRRRCFTPLIHYLYNSFHTKAQLYRMLKPVAGKSIGFAAVSNAYNRALEFKQNATVRLKKRFKEATGNTGDVYVVLLGRPYTVLSPAMNKGIVDIFSSLGIKTFFQDMLSYEKQEVQSVEPLLNEIHWHYAAKIIESAQIVARTDGAYPVLLTSFRCSPDSFVMEYFKKVMEAHGKPYLILQIDEHDSSLGYETRIEAAIRSFRNHHASSKARKEVTLPQYVTALIPEKDTPFSGKTLLIPNWDDLSPRLIVAALHREGIDARLLEESKNSIQKSMRYNTGQCIPLNIIAQDFIDTVKKHDLDPSKTVLWMGMSSIACNIRLYPVHIRKILQSCGNGMEKASIYVGSMSLHDLSIKMPAASYFAYMFGGYIKRIGCMLRPYEKVKGQTDAAIEKSMAILEEAFYGKRPKEEALEEAIACFKDIPIKRRQRPKVAIFGDLYARDNRVINQDLIRFIEENGGEVVTTPYSEYLKMIAGLYLRKWMVEGHYLEAFSSRALIAGLKLQESTYYKYFEQILNESQPRYNDSPDKILAEFNIRVENTGESMDNILKIHYITKHHPDVVLFVQASPSFCCPALVTEAMARRIEKKTGIPIVSVTYDGTGGNKNDVIIPYLRYPRHKRSDHKSADFSTFI